MVAERPAAIVNSYGHPHTLATYGTRCVCVCFESSIYRDSDIVNLQQVMADVTKGFKYDQNNVTNYIPYPRERGPMGGAPYIGPRLGGVGRYSRYQ